MAKKPNKLDSVEPSAAAAADETAEIPGADPDNVEPSDPPPVSGPRPYTIQGHQIFLGKEAIGKPHATRKAARKAISELNKGAE